MIADPRAIRKAVASAFISLTIVGAGWMSRTHRVVHASMADRGSSSTATPTISGGQWSQDHYSALTQINRSNVSKLKVAWTYDVGEQSSGMETNPLVVGRVLFAATPAQKVIALDAATGKLLWKFDSGIPANQPIRGVAYWTDGKQGIVLAGIMNYLYALDADTGTPVPGFGENGRIDLRKGLGGMLGEDYEKQSVVLTSAGIIFKDLIIVGGRNPETAPAPPGDIRAFNVRTGKLAWDFHTIPHPGEAGYETWPANAWKTAGAANNWAGMTLDPQRGVVYVPTGSAVPDFYGAARVGDDRWADSLLALDAATGKLLWSFQGVHHDIWDRDFPAPPALLRVRRNGRMVDAIAQTTKQGFVFLLDRDTGKPLFPVEERPVPASTVPGEVASRTQPFPLLPAPYTRQTVTANDLTTRTPEARAYALKLFRTFLGGQGQFVPLSVGQQTLVAPGFDGGAEYGGPGLDPQSAVLYVNSNNWVDTGGLEPKPVDGGLGINTYQSQCALCHRNTRQGSPPEFPSLIDVDKRMTPEQIVANIHNGKGRMPSFPNIQGDQLHALLEYLRTGKDPAHLTGAAAGAKPPEDSELKQTDIQRSNALNLAARTHLDPAGARVYAAHCAICHGPNLEGVVPGFPGLLGVDDRLTAGQIADLIHKGKGRMPAFSRVSINDSDLRSLMHFLGAREMLTAPEEPEVALMNRYNFTGYRKFLDADDYPAVSTPWGTLSAISMNTGKFLWRVPLGEYPELKAKGIPTTGSENYGGPVVTAGGLVIIAATVHDRKLHFYDSRTGALLWEFELPFASVATPTTYMVDGKQFIVVTAGGSKITHGSPTGKYVALALP